MAETFRGASVLVTGATGYVGSLVSDLYPQQLPSGPQTYVAWVEYQSGNLAPCMCLECTWREALNCLVWVDTLMSTSLGSD